MPIDLETLLNPEIFCDDGQLRLQLILLIFGKSESQISAYKCFRAQNNPNCPSWFRNRALDPVAMRGKSANAVADANGHICPELAASVCCRFEPSLDYDTVLRAFEAGPRTEAKTNKRSTEVYADAKRKIKSVRYDNTPESATINQRSIEAKHDDDQALRKIQLKDAENKMLSDQATRSHELDYAKMQLKYDEMEKKLLISQADAAHTQRLELEIEQNQVVFEAKLAACKKSLEGDIRQCETKYQGQLAIENQQHQDEVTETALVHQRELSATETRLNQQHQTEVTETALVHQRELSAVEARLNLQHQYEIAGITLDHQRDVSTIETRLNQQHQAEVTETALVHKRAILAGEKKFKALTKRHTDVCEVATGLRRDLKTNVEEVHEMKQNCERTLLANNEAHEKELWETEKLHAAKINIVGTNLTEELVSAQNDVEIATQAKIDSMNDAMLGMSHTLNLYTGGTSRGAQALRQQRKIVKLEAQITKLTADISLMKHTYQAHHEANAFNAAEFLAINEHVDDSTFIRNREANLHRNHSRNELMQDLLIHSAHIALQKQYGTYGAREREAKEELERDAIEAKQIPYMVNLERSKALEIAAVADRATGMEPESFQAFDHEDPMFDDDPNDKQRTRLPNTSSK